MSKMPSLKAREVLDILFKAGFEKLRTSGSHVRLGKGALRVTVPFHASRSVPFGTLKSIIRQSGMSVDEFIAFSKKK